MFVLARLMPSVVLARERETPIVISSIGPTLFVVRPRSLLVAIVKPEEVTLPGAT